MQLGFQLCLLEVGTQTRTSFKSTNDDQEHRTGPRVVQLYLFNRIQPKRIGTISRLTGLGGTVVE